MSEKLPKLEKEGQASVVLDHIEHVERKVLRIIWEDCLGDLILAAARNATPTAGCECCDGTGFTGDRGPGICGNQEYHMCDCVVNKIRKLP